MSVLRGDQARALFARMHQDNAPSGSAVPVPAPPRPTPGPRAPAPAPLVAPATSRGGRVSTFEGRHRVRVRPDPPGARALQRQRPLTVTRDRVGDEQGPAVPVVAVVTTGEDRPMLAEVGSTFTDILTVAARVRTHTAMRAVAVQLSSTTAVGIVRHVRATPGPVAALYLVDTPPGTCEQVRDLLHETIPVVTEHHTEAVVVVTAALRALSRRGAGARSSTLLVVGAAQNPVVAVLAGALGVSTVTSWNPRYFGDRPLPVIWQAADVIIDLLRFMAADDDGGGVHAFRPAPVIRPDPVATVQALPALLHQLGTDTGVDPLSAAAAVTAAAAASRDQPRPVPTDLTPNLDGAHTSLSPHPDMGADVPEAQTPTSADLEETR